MSHPSLPIQHLHHRGFSAWIAVGSKPVSVYAVSLDARAHRVSCYIAGEHNQPFRVFWQDHGSGVDTAAFLDINGAVFPGRFLQGEGTSSRGGVRTGPDTELPFVFQLETPAPAPADGGAPLSSGGTILLRIKQIVRTGMREPNAPLALPTPPPAAGGVRVALGSPDALPQYAQHSYTWGVRARDGRAQAPTFVSFLFRYRTQEFLERAGIAPPQMASLRLPPLRIPPDAPGAQPADPLLFAHSALSVPTASVRVPSAPASVLTATASTPSLSAAASVSATPASTGPATPRARAPLQRSVSALSLPEIRHLAVRSRNSAARSSVTQSVRAPPSAAARRTRRAREAQAQALFERAMRLLRERRAGSEAGDEGEDEVSDGSAE